MLPSDWIEEVVVNGLTQLIDTHYMIDFYKVRDTIMPGLKIDWFREAIISQLTLTIYGY